MPSRAKSEADAIFRDDVVSAFEAVGRGIDVPATRRAGVVRKSPACRQFAANSGFSAGTGRFDVKTAGSPLQVGQDFVLDERGGAERISRQTPYKFA